MVILLCKMFENIWVQVTRIVFPFLIFLLLNSVLDASINRSSRLFLYFGENLFQSWKSSHKVSQRVLFVGSAHWDHPLANVWQVGQPWLVAGSFKQENKVNLCSFYRRLDSPLGGRHQWVCCTTSPHHVMSQQVVTAQSQPFNSAASNYYNEELQMQRNIFAFEPLTFSLFLSPFFWS